MPTPTALAANAYSALARLHDDAAAIGGGKLPGLGAGQGTGDSFGAMLKEAMNTVTEAAHKGDAQAQAVAAGKANMVDVVTAVAETETTFQTLVSVRDKVIAAYEDVLKMQI
jgi:flagellar hook-basal body complex protein FliE